MDGVFPPVSAFPALGRQEKPQSAALDRIQAGIIASLFPPVSAFPPLRRQEQVAPRRFSSPQSAGKGTPAWERT